MDIGTWKLQIIMENRRWIKYIEKCHIKNEKLTIVNEKKINIKLKINNI